MRTLLLIFFQTYELRRRYVSLLPTRLTQLVTDWSTGFKAVPGSTAYASGHPRRSLSLGSIPERLLPALLDTPHVKAYRLCYDNRLYKQKSLATLRLRTRLRLAGASALPVASGYLGFPYGLELGAWGAKTSNALQYWSNSRGILWSWVGTCLAEALASRHPLNENWQLQQPWAAISCGWMSAVGSHPRSLEPGLSGEEGQLGGGSALQLWRPFDTAVERAEDAGGDALLLVESCDFLDTASQQVLCDIDASLFVEDVARLQVQFISGEAAVQLAGQSSWCANIAHGVVAIGTSCGLATSHPSQRLQALLALEILSSEGVTVGCVTP